MGGTHGAVMSIFLFLMGSAMAGRLAHSACWEKAVGGRGFVVGKSRAEREEKKRELSGESSSRRG
jgi:hypothetical protein